MININQVNNNLLPRIKSSLPSNVYLVQSFDELQEVIKYRRNYYQDGSPEVQMFHDDGFDEFSYVFYVRDDDGGIIGSARLLVDSLTGLPEESILPSAVHDLRRSGKKLAELGRLLITGDKSKTLSLLYNVVYETAKIIDINYILIVMKKSNVSSHEKMMKIKTLSENMGLSWDEEKKELCLISWDINAESEKFLRFSQRYVNNKQFEEWNDYSKYHFGVFLSVQHEVYSSVSTKCVGNVLDLGCGSGRIMGFMKENLNVKSYTGIDYSKGMIDLAIQYKENLDYQRAKLILDKIEHVSGKFDTIISNLSYYSWGNKNKCLEVIKDSLLDEGRFLLVTPNNQFDIPKLANLVKREAFGHPYYNEFLSINYHIANTVEYPSLDELISQVRLAGFAVEKAHKEFFLGGVSYLELRKMS